MLHTDRFHLQDIHLDSFILSYLNFKASFLSSYSPNILLLVKLCYDDHIQFFENSDFGRVNVLSMQDLITEMKG